MEFGATMMRVVDADRQDAPRELVLNGESVHFASGTTARATDYLLDYFEARCDARDGGLAEAVVRAAGEHAARGHQAEAERLLGIRPLVRHDDEDALALAHKWAKVSAVLFAVGAVTGTILSFEMGLLWPGLMSTFGYVIGLPFALEGIAFLL